MRHGVKKIKFKQGKDANEMLMRKLVVNFLAHGKLTTTTSRAKVLKSLVEAYVEKAKEKKEANKNFLLSKLGDRQLVKKLFLEVGPVFKTRAGGCVKLSKLNERTSDGAIVSKLEWVQPIVVETKPTKPVEK